MATKHFIFDLAGDCIVSLDSWSATLSSFFSSDSVISNTGLMRKLLRITDVGKVLARALVAGVGRLARLMVAIVSLTVLLYLAIRETIRPELLNFIFGSRCTIG